MTLYRTNRRTTSTLGQFFNLPSTIYVRILRQGTVVASETRECYVGTTEIVTIKVSQNIADSSSGTRLVNAAIAKVKTGLAVSLAELEPQNLLRTIGQFLGPVTTSNDNIAGNGRA